MSDLKHDPDLNGSFAKRPRVAHMFNHGWWRLAVGGDWRLAVGDWRLAAVSGGWPRLVVGDWWLVAVGSGCQLAVGHRWQLAAAGDWQLVVPWGGPEGRSLTKKKCRSQRTPLSSVYLICR